MSDGVFNYHQNLAELKINELRDITGEILKSIYSYRDIYSLFIPHREKEDLINWRT